MPLSLPRLPAPAKKPLTCYICVQTLRKNRVVSESYFKVLVQQTSTNLIPENEDFHRFLHGGHRRGNIGCNCILLFLKILMGDGFSHIAIGHVDSRGVLSRATPATCICFFLVHVLSMFAKVQMDYAVRIW